MTAPPGPKNASAPTGRAVEATDKSAGRLIDNQDTAPVKPPAGLCWIACGVSHCACCPLASEVAT